MKILITGGRGNLANIIKQGLGANYEIACPTRLELNVLSFSAIQQYLNEQTFDVLIHTAIVGGRRTKTETSDIVYQNLLMLENLLLFADKFKMIINFDSAAIYDRTTDIFNRSEEDITRVPNDYYGFSKYLIHKRCQQFDNVYNLRIFNVFHENEESDRFIKMCFTKENVTIFDNKYFDFVYKDDFIKVVQYYIEHANEKDGLHKTINVCYPDKYTLSEVANMIIGDKSKIIIINENTSNNYSGNGQLLQSLNLDLIGLKKSLLTYSYSHL
jgi:nucleoside-diphosphate-sugar epimerase